MTFIFHSSLTTDFQTPVDLKGALRSTRHLTMKRPFWCMFEFLSLTSAAVISPLSFLNASESINPVGTQPVVENPDQRFKTEVFFMAPRLPLISCLVNTVEFLMILGLQEFSGEMGEVAWKLNEYPHVGMVVTPLTEDGRIERRFVVWGLGAGVARMIHLNRFQAATFILSCTYTLLFSFSIQTTLEVLGLVFLEGIMHRSQSGPPTCLSTFFLTGNCER